MEKTKSFALSLILLLFSGIFCSCMASEPEAAAPAKAAACSGTLPVVHIDTDEGAPIVSKEVYVDATYYIDNMGHDQFESVGTSASPLPLQIRGRGHSSWQSPKKPYKLKLGEKKALLGMPKSKHWALLKPSENTIAGFQLGRILQMAWTPRLQPVEVVLNGDYIGLYFLTETIRIASDRVDIYEQADGETDPNLISGGWLVEIDNYSESGQIRIKENDNWKLNVKPHSPEDLSDQQRAWLLGEFTAMNAAIYSPDKRSTEWERYIDVESMARFFIVQEVMDNPDGFHGSFYLHKDLGDDAKWVAGPLWDLVCYFREKTDYTFRLPAHYTFTPHWIGEIIQYDSFCRAVKKAWDEVYPSEILAIGDYIDDNVLPLAEAWQADCQRWGDDPAQTASLRASRLRQALEGNIDWLAHHLPESPYGGIASPEADDAPVEVYTLMGISLGSYATVAQARAALPKGIYIANGQKLVVK